MTMITWLRDASEKLGIPLIAIALFNGVCCIFLAYYHIGPHHADEHYQILEFANARLGYAPLEELPWEFESRIRATIQPVLAAIWQGIFHLFGVHNPFWVNWFLKSCAAALSIWTMLHTLRYADDLFDSKKDKRRLWLVGLMLWFLPYLLIRFTSENISGIAFIWATLLLLRHPKNQSNDFSFLIGLLLGFSFLIRYQMAFAILAFGLWLLLIHKPKFLFWIKMILGGLLMLGVGVLVDWWFYGELVFTPYLYFESNILEGKAATFGVHHWSFYITNFLVFGAPPLSLLLLIFMALGWWKAPKHLWTWCMILFIAGHTAVGHKELRFLFPMLYCLPYFIVKGWKSWPFQGGNWKYVQSFFYGFNIILWCIMLWRSVYLFVDFNEYAQKWLYDESSRSDVPVVTLSRQQAPHEHMNLHLNYFQHKNYQPLNHRSTQEMVDYLDKHDSLDHIYYYHLGNTDPPQIPGYRLTRVYIAFPKWARDRNYFGWQSMVKMMSYYKINRIE